MKRYVSLEAKHCIVCNEEYETGDVLLDLSLEQSLERKTVTGVGVCDSCNRPDYVWLVGLDPSASDLSRIDKHTHRMPIGDATMNGDMVQLRREVWSKLFNIPIPEGRFVFVEDRVIKELVKEEEERDGHSGPSDE